MLGSVPAGILRRTLEVFREEIFRELPEAVLEIVDNGNANYTAM